MNRRAPPPAREPPDCTSQSLINSWSNFLNAVLAWGTLEWSIYSRAFAKSAGFVCGLWCRGSSVQAAASMIPWAKKCRFYRRFLHSAATLYITAVSKRAETQAPCHAKMSSEIEPHLSPRCLSRIPAGFVVPVNAPWIRRPLWFKNGTHFGVHFTTCQRKRLLVSVPGAITVVPGGTNPQSFNLPYQACSLLCCSSQ